MEIGPYRLASKVLLAPMAGVTDQPMRQISRRMGAALAVGEMLTSDTALWDSPKSSSRLPDRAEQSPRAIQIVGNNPALMAQAARQCVALGAQIIDINLGCPAKKVCRQAAGSALLRDEPLVAGIFQAVTSAVNVPVTAKIRTGWDSKQRNAAVIGRIAQDHGIAALTIHGRTRACRFMGEAEYDTIASVKQQLIIPVIANGDIDSPAKAAAVLRHTGADAVMIGRAALGNPWLLQQIAAHLNNQPTPAVPSPTQRLALIRQHLAAIHTWHGPARGVRIARKHIGWYFNHPQDKEFMHRFNRLLTAAEQLASLQHYQSNTWSAEHAA